jgi:hypothetical protein
VDSGIYFDIRALKFNLNARFFQSATSDDHPRGCISDELLAHLIDSEWDYRQNRRIERQILYARFRYKASIEELHYHADRSIDRNQVMRLADCTFIDTGMKICSLPEVLGLEKVIWHRQSDIRHVCWATGYCMPVRQSFLPN